MQLVMTSLMNGNVPHSDCSAINHAQQHQRGNSTQWHTENTTINDVIVGKRMYYIRLDSPDRLT